MEEQNEKIKELSRTIEVLKSTMKDYQNDRSQIGEELMTRQEVANFFKIDLSTLHHWTKGGKLKSYGIGKRVYYKKSEIHNALVQIEPLNRY